MVLVRSWAGSVGQHGFAAIRGESGQLTPQVVGDLDAVGNGLLVPRAGAVAGDRDRYGRVRGAAATYLVEVLGRRVPASAEQDEQVPFVAHAVVVEGAADRGAVGGPGEEGDHRAQSEAEAVPLRSPERRDRSVLGRDRVDRLVAFGIQRPPRLERYAAQRVIVDLAHRDLRGGHVEHERSRAGRDRERQRVGSEHRLGAAPRVDQGLAGRDADADQATVCHPAGVVPEHAEVVVVRDGADRDAVLLSRRDDRVQCAHRDDGTESLLAVNGQVAGAVPVVAAGAGRACGAVPQPAQQSRQAQEAVGRHPLRLGDDEQFGLLGRGGGRHTGGDQESFGQCLGREQICVHVDHPRVESLHSYSLLDVLGG